MPRRRLFMFVILSQTMTGHLLMAQATAGDTGVLPGNTYVGDLENISMTSGNLSMSFPLVHVPGRGGAAYDLTLAYNSNFWNYRFANGGPNNNLVIGWIDSAYVTAGNFTPVPGWTLMGGRQED